MSKVENDKSLYINIDEICNIFKKENVSDLTQEEWNKLKMFKRKISISSSFAHRFCKKSNEIESKLN